MLPWTTVQPIQVVNQTWTPSAFEMVTILKAGGRFTHSGTHWSVWIRGRTREVTSWSEVETFCKEQGVTLAP